MSMEIYPLGQNKPVQQVKKIQAQKVEEEQTSSKSQDKLTLSSKSNSFVKRIQDFKAWLKEHPGQRSEKIKVAQELMQSGEINNPDFIKKTAESMLHKDPIG